MDNHGFRAARKDYLFRLKCADMCDNYSITKRERMLAWQLLVLRFGERVASYIACKDGEVDLIKDYQTRIQGLKERLKFAKEMRTICDMADQAYNIQDASQVFEIYSKAFTKGYMAAMPPPIQSMVIKFHLHPNQRTH